MKHWPIHVRKTPRERREHERRSVAARAANGAPGSVDPCGWTPRPAGLPPFEQVAYCIVKDADPQYPRALMRQGDNDLWWWFDVDGNDLHPEDVLFWKLRGPLPALTPTEGTPT